ncbi:UNVERIFIED_CONTAM: hypothetical protein PYX00_011494 [Menopon gallinae]|uniref:Coatomer subunit gamma n=1 Tax=Menopon gallinae TaxID=328185 RepID=A0AAW2H7L4_9NEOP
MITRKCTAAINSLLLLSTQKEVQPNTLKSIFVAILRAFQSKEVYLKHMVYLAIERTGPKTPDSFLAINSLCKDLGQVGDKLKPACLRALFSIVPGPMLNDFEKTLAQSYSTNKMAPIIYYDLVSKGKIGRSIVESSGGSFQRMALVFELKKNDRSFLLNFLKKNQFCRGEEAVFAAKLAFYLFKENRKFLSELIQKFLVLKYNEEMVFVEAANSLLRLEDEEVLVFLDQTIQSVRSLLRSKSLVLKFASIRILNRLARRFPHECEVANPEVESLINDKNKNINILALTTILQIGTEDSVDRFISRVSKVPMSDTYKYLLFDSITSLCRKFPSKSLDFLAFYKNTLSEKSSLEFKIFLVKKINEIVGERRDKFVSMLSEYIEDSQHFMVTIHILGILGREIPKTSNPKRHLIHILNRLTLENNHVRVAALQTLANVSQATDFNFADILRRCAKEEDEMIRDMALFLLANQKSGEDLRLDELGEFREAMKGYFPEENAADAVIKECRDVFLSEKDADVAISVQKVVFRDRVVLKVRLENTLSSILLKSGKLVLLMRGSGGDEEFDFQYSNIRFGETKVDEVVIRNKDTKRLSELCEASIEDAGLVITFNSIIEYKLCPESDLADVESETLDLSPFSIGFVDFFAPQHCTKELCMSRSTSFALDSADVNESTQKILRLLNLKVVDQSHDMSQIVLSGVRGDIELKVVIDLWLSINVHGNIDAFSNTGAQGPAARLCFSAAPRRPPDRTWREEGERPLMNSHYSSKVLIKMLILQTAILFAVYMLYVFYSTYFRYLMLVPVVNLLYILWVAAQKVVRFQLGVELEGEERADSVCGGAAKMTLCLEAQRQALQEKNGVEERRVKHRNRQLLSFKHYILKKIIRPVVRNYARCAETSDGGEDASFHLDDSFIFDHKLQTRQRSMDRRAALSLRLLKNISEDGVKLLRQISECGWIFYQKGNPRHRLAVFTLLVNYFNFLMPSYESIYIEPFDEFIKKGPYGIAYEGPVSSGSFYFYSKGFAKSDDGDPVVAFLYLLVYCKKYCSGMLGSLSIDSLGFLD